MNVKKLVALAAMAVGMSAQASSVILPGANVMSAALYGDFTVYSLDLLAQWSEVVPGSAADAYPWEVQGCPVRNGAGRTAAHQQPGPLRDSSTDAAQYVYALGRIEVRSVSD